MRPIAFRKGTLVLAFPNRIAEQVRKSSDIIFRSKGTQWACWVGQAHTGMWAVGTYVQQGPNIYTTGHAVTDCDDLWTPEWWDEPGYREETPEPWRIVELFGCSNKLIYIGQD